VRGLTPPRRATEDQRPGEVPGAVLRVVEPNPSDPHGRAGWFARLVAALGDSARLAGVAAVASGRWLTDVVVDVAPHVPVRDLETLRAHHAGLTGNALAQSLIDTAARTTGAVGLAGGVVTAVEFTAPPLLLSAPILVAAETVAVVAIELKLVAELHEVYGHPVPGTTAVRAAAYLGSWTRRRGLADSAAPSGFTGLIGGAARRELRRQILRRGAESSVTVIPFLAGAMAGASLNSRETKRLGNKVAKDLGGVRLRA